MTTVAMPISIVPDPTQDTANLDYAQVGDFELAVATGRKNMDAFAELYKRYHQRVYNICLRIVRNSETAEDLTHDVFIQVFRKVAGFKGNSKFMTWLYQISVNQALMHFRKRYVKIEKNKPDAQIPEQIVPGTSDLRRMTADQRIAIKSALANLSPGYRNIFILHDIGGYEHKEIAEILGCSIGTSKSQLSKARHKIRKHLNRHNIMHEHTIV